MKNVLNTGLRIVFVILLLATAAFVGSAAAYAETAPAAGEEDVSRPQKTADAELQSGRLLLQPRLGDGF